MSSGGGGQKPQDVDLSLRAQGRQAPAGLHPCPALERVSQLQRPPERTIPIDNPNFNEQGHPFEHVCCV